ncbi:hypothetical protein JQ617_29335 [Bradyrhizobium sp. KB893862 SZCCT0404]|uniref:hypothetical protein n=1 Tax=Bradyrhizobium sp. KB893862 SZCCT0404 TaxID=2807672 RepID=UPI001BAD496D|nr:hypothetical protein [Bradyrhizobium sp. KB893862 SZCCT0404]MBR1178096.1 hypothetical protein [Bradyrhizobium sp. KB893862 SZCCT0404]
MASDAGRSSPGAGAVLAATLTPHFMQSLRTLILSAALIILTGIVPGQTAGSRARLADARAIAALELAGEKTLGPCRIDGEAWMDYAIPADLARKYLGRPKGASAAPPPASPRAVLDPRGTRPALFCSKDESRARRDAAVAALRPGDRTTRIGLAYTWPVFDAAGRTAIVIVEHDVGTWQRDAEGSSVRASGEMFGVARVYRKRSRHWRRVATEEVYSGLY